ncbi:helix-turn-helix domain-containing protein, partial [Anaerotruncus colihominis]|uniref:helix-turn-helix domain-containing protein n=1 Tax=Anaerotruncus colihominis TaxID=169435 RepID=UPI00210A3112|nr:helix-turn-helix domain-containing protein [Anaerotruncus colihominis]
MNTFAQRLKYAMEQADLKQSTLSELTGISKPSINQYRSGKNTPGLERVKALADAIGVTFDF